MLRRGVPVARVWRVVTFSQVHICFAVHLRDVSHQCGRESTQSDDESVNAYKSFKFWKCGTGVGAMY